MAAPVACSIGACAPRSRRLSYPFSWDAGPHLFAQPETGRDYLAYGDAGIPILWVPTPPSNSFASIAHCMWQIDFSTRRFGVQNVVITAWNRDGTQVSVEDLHRTLLHEMGHALGIADHSPNPEDIMYPWRDVKPGSLAEGWVLPNAKPNGTVLAGVRRVH